MERKIIFNENGYREAEKRSIINANTTNLIEINEIKYNWAYEMYKTMGFTNFWIPNEIPMLEDKQCYDKDLNEYEKRGIELVLSFLIALDSFQVEWLAELKRFITAPEITLSLTAQEFQEALHSFSYQYILESIVDPIKADEIYNYWREDEVLRDRNRVISDIYNEFIRKPNEENFVKGIIANYILESIYFYSGFAFFYTLGRQGKMTNTVQQIKYINRDEALHITLFRNIILNLRKENPELFNDEIIKWIYEQFKYAIDSEIKWGKYIIQNNKIIGLTDRIIDMYIKYLGNLRLKQIGLNPVYPDVNKNPLEWIDEFRKINTTKTDFFQRKPLSYSKSNNLKW